MRPNMIFLHIPKCGGNTFHQIIKREYKKDPSFAIRVLEDFTLNIDEFINLPEETRHQIKLLRGHMHFGLHKYLSEPSVYVTFLRNPVDRVISHYKYVLSNTNHQLYEFAKSRTINEYVKDLNIYLNNATIVHLSGLDRHTPPNVLLSTAKKNIERYFPVVGILEYYDESLILMKSEFRWKLPYYQKLNFTDKMAVNGLSEETYELIKAYNKEDILLYELFKEKMEQKIKQMTHKQQLDLMMLKLKSKMYSSAKNVVKRFK